MLQNIFIHLREDGRRGTSGSFLAYSDCYVTISGGKIPFISCVVKKNNINAIKNTLINNYENRSLCISIKSNTSNAITCKTHELKILENNDEY